MTLDELDHEYENLKQLRLELEEKLDEYSRRSAAYLKAVTQNVLLEFPLKKHSEVEK